MFRQVLIIISLWFTCPAFAQESFFIKDYQISVQVQEDANLKITENIFVHFLEPRHGIIRNIPFRYKISDAGDSLLKGQGGWIYNGYRYTKISDIKVAHFSSKVTKTSDYISIKIGTPNKMVDGDQVYQISYKIAGAVNFFPGYSELYLNLTGNQWAVNIEKTEFRIQLFKPMPEVPKWFVATGAIGSRSNNTSAKWENNQSLSGYLNIPLSAFEGITAGVRMPAGFLSKPDYSKMGEGWLLLPLIILVLMYLVWKKWGRDLPVTVQAEYYPPPKISPSVAGYVIDGKLDKRDLTALIPYWGAGGFLKVKETESKQFLGLIKDKEYEFIKVKDLNADAYRFEKDMFDGLFKDGDSVFLKDLKDSFYQTMNRAKQDLESEINTDHYYTTFSRSLARIIPIIGVFVLILGLIQLFSNYPLDFLLWLSVTLSSLPIIIFGALMSKKTVKGTELYEKLLGFKEFIKSVEKDRLKEFLKEDPQYFDKVLPFAIVFNVADTWKDHLKGLDVPPPTWYQGYYVGNAFSTMGFMDSLDHSMNAMSNSFYSMPSSSGSSGGSFGGGGFSGGGFGGGGGSSW